MFVLCSDITIGSLRFSGVNSVEIKRSLHSYTDTAIIKLPSRAKVYKRNDDQPALQSLAPQIHEGDKVVIMLGYDGVMKTEFEGFVVSRGTDMPLVIECEGYSYQLRLKVDVTGFIEKTTVKELLEIACGITDAKRKRPPKPLTDVTVICQEDIPLVNMSFNHLNGLQIIDEIKKITLNTLAIFFKSPRVLWCGFTYTSCVGNVAPEKDSTVSYRLGFNCLKDNGLKIKVIKEPVQVLLKSSSLKGVVLESKSGAASAPKKDKVIMSNVPAQAMLDKIANEKQYQANYSGYTGHLTGFLQPYCEPGYAATVIDMTDLTRKGVYMVESTTVTYGITGARREVEIGPKLGFTPS